MRLYCHHHQCACDDISGWDEDKCEVTEMDQTNLITKKCALFCPSPPTTHPVPVVLIWPIFNWRFELPPGFLAVLLALLG